MDEAVEVDEVVEADVVDVVAAATARAQRAKIRAQRAKAHLREAKATSEKPTNPKHPKIKRTLKK